MCAGAGEGAGEWVMLYGSDVEEAETTMPIPALLTGASSGVGWSSGILFDRPVALKSISKVLWHLNVSMLWLSGRRSSIGPK